MTEKTPAEQVLKVDVPVPQSVESFWMPIPGSDMSMGGIEDLLRNPKVAEILKVLSTELLLVEPTRRFVLQKAAEMADAKLSVLYSSEELEVMKEEVQRLEG